ncbi:methyltransferase [Pseudomonas saudimassiliensis]|uniref:tRNA 5-carboxymethoxyuridine methyltransferase n=1 Tax=Pseudomonas saudimassiliensis TaxID=1461581 RepID=A0A078MFQ5_9PSED|nr:methyltransferase domain-containing protein [Pseudomonas saudimassiliensis]CEA06133.1 methyltransferase [Pseudomonas saudimassiliensis]CEF27558.1 methyltransferase [Pseudomonas saudimassiliensis]
MADRYFDQLGAHFARKIYAGPKGAIRLAVLTRDLEEWLPEVAAAARPLRVLDVGAGLGHISEWLLQRGHSVTVTEPAEEMLSAARERLQPLPLQPGQSLQFMPLPLQELPTRGERYDLVICHAVLEWLADPAAALLCLRQLVNQGGAVSLAFYNRDALIYKNLIKGQFRKLQRNQLAGEGKRSLTPQQPLDPREVYAWIAEADFHCREQTGVRVFHDYMHEPFKSAADAQEVIEQELLYSRHPAYRHLGRYLHCWLRPASSGPAATTR